MRKDNTPNYIVGDQICSALYAGKITGMFYDKQWHYLIGDNVSLPKDKNLEGYKSGSKFIRDSDVLYWLTDKNKWEEA